MHLIKEDDIATAWNLPVESAADPTAMKLHQKRPLQLTKVCVCVCVCQANAKCSLHSACECSDTCDMMSICFSGKDALDDLQGKIVVLDDDDSGDYAQVRWASHHSKTYF